MILPGKFDEQIRSRFDEWVYILKTSKVRTEFTAAGIHEAGERLDFLKMTPEEKKEYEWMKYDEMDYKSQLYTAELKGKIRGEEKGILKGKVEVARNMKLRGLSTEDISEMTGLSIQEIETLQ